MTIDTKYPMQCGMLRSAIRLIVDKIDIYLEQGKEWRDDKSLFEMSQKARKMLEDIEKDDEAP